MLAAGLAAGVAGCDLRVVAVDQLPLRTTDLPLLLRTRALSRRADARVAVGAGSARRVEDFYVLGRGSVCSIPNGVPDLGAPPHRPARPGPMVVGSLGRLDRMKGYDVLIAALATMDGANVVVVGDGAERRQLIELAAASGVADRFALA
ncbi:glycosyltransferase, partial [Frankia sp. CcWB2]